VKSRRERKGSDRVLVGKPDEKTLLGRSAVDGRIIRVLKERHSSNPS
jgi:hypothetical protein